MNKRWIRRKYNRIALLLVCLLAFLWMLPEQAYMDTPVEILFYEDSQYGYLDDEWHIPSDISPLVIQILAPDTISGFYYTLESAPDFLNCVVENDEMHLSVRQEMISVEAQNLSGNIVVACHAGDAVWYGTIEVVLEVEIESETAEIPEETGDSDEPETGASDTAGDGDGVSGGSGSESQDGSHQGDKGDSEKDDLGPEEAPDKLPESTAPSETILEVVETIETETSETSEAAETSEAGESETEEKVEETEDLKETEDPDAHKETEALSDPGAASQDKKHKNSGRQSYHRAMKKALSDDAISEQPASSDNHTSSFVLLIVILLGMGVGIGGEIGRYKKNI